MISSYVSFPHSHGGSVGVTLPESKLSPRHLTAVVAYIFTVVVSCTAISDAGSRCTAVTLF